MNREFMNVNGNEAEEPLSEKAKNFKLSLDDGDIDIPDYKPERKRPKRQKRVVGSFAKIMFAVVIVGIAIFLSLLIIFSFQEVAAVNKPKVTVLVDIAPNSGTLQVANELQEKGVINSAFLFRAYVKLTGVKPNYQYGTYELNTAMSYDKIIDNLGRYSEKQEEITIQFTEGITLHQMAVMLEEKKVCKAEDFLKAINETEFGYDFEKSITTNRLRYYKVEGYAFPDTYNFFVNENPVSVAKKLFKNFNARYTPDLEAQRQKIGLSQEDMIIVASIVQKEAGQTAEMRKVASVYLNRLKSDGEYSRLQADPTRDYANEIKAQMDIINQEMVDAYNTYEGIGLPPGPICNPGLDAIKAVLYADETPYYYFCTNIETGEFFYAETLDQHNVNLKKAGLR